MRFKNRIFIPNCLIFCQFLVSHFSHIKSREEISPKTCLVSREMRDHLPALGLLPSCPIFHPQKSRTCQKRHWKLLKKLWNFLKIIKKANIWQKMSKKCRKSIYHLSLINDNYSFLCNP